MSLSGTYGHDGEVSLLMLRFGVGHGRQFQATYIFPQHVALVCIQSFIYEKGFYDVVNDVLIAYMDIVWAFGAHFTVQSLVMVHIAKGMGCQVHKQLEGALVAVIVACFEIALCLSVVLKGIDLVLNEYFQLMTPCYWGLELELEVYVQTVILFGTGLCGEF